MSFCVKWVPLIAPKGRQRTDGGGVSRDSGERNPRQRKKLFQALKGRQKEVRLFSAALSGLATYPALSGGSAFAPPPSVLCRRFAAKDKRPFEQSLEF